LLGSGFSACPGATECAYETALIVYDHMSHGFPSPHLAMPGLGQGFTVNLDLAGFSSCFQSDIAWFLDFVCQTVWPVKKSDEQGICLKNRAPPSSL